MSTMRDTTPHFTLPAHLTKMRAGLTALHRKDRA